MGRASRDKGKRNERAAAALWQKITGHPARRSVQYCGSDGTADLIAQPGLHLEVKARKSIAALRFYDQASSDAKDGDLPIVVMKEDRGDFFVLVRLDDLAKLSETLTRADAGEPEA
tara:strand:- start:3241 stop:3588 length:348 start_codon:yes stop_codon:yes gene_type:complete